MPSKDDSERFAMFKDGIQVSAPDHLILLKFDWMQKGVFERAPAPEGVRLKAGYEIREVTPDPLVDDIQTWLREIEA